MDQDGQRLGLTFLNFLSTTPEVNPTQDNLWKQFVLAMSFSRDLLASLTHAIATPLADDLAIASLQVVESLYTELEVKAWAPDEMEVTTMITLLISEGLLSQVLAKTRQYSQRPPYTDALPYTDAAALLLTLSLRANTTDFKIRMELSQAIHTLSVEEDVQILDLLIGWLEDALLGFPWIWHTVRNARTIPLLINRMDSTCHQAQKLSDMNLGLRAADFLCLLCQDASFCNDILDIGTHRLLHTADEARKMQMSRPDRDDPIRSRALDIQLAVIECVKLMTVPRSQADPQPGINRTPSRGWTVETTWKWTLQTMLALKSITIQQRPDRTNINYAAGLHTLHHLLTITSHLTTQQRENAWFLLGREEIPDLYAHLICSHLQELDGNVVIGMATVLEGHTQAVSQVSRQSTATDEIIYRCLALLDMICPRGWSRDKEATGEMPRWIHGQTGAGQWDFPNLMKFEINVLSGQPLQPSIMEEWSASPRTIWAPINCHLPTLLHILLQHHPLGSLSEFRENSMIALQQRSPQGLPLSPHFFNPGDTQAERRSRRISDLIHRATGLQIP